jgi:amidohydrolase
VLAGHVILAVQAIVARYVDPLKPAVISFGKIEGGVATNILSGAVKLEGTLRYFDRDVREQLHHELRRAFSVADALGGAGEIQIHDGNPPVVNDVRVTALTRSAAASVLGETDIGVADAIMGAEDFAHLARQAPGCFFWLGAEIADDPRRHHTPNFDIDESCLPRGAAVLAAAARRILAEW